MRAAALIALAGLSFVAANPAALAQAAPEPASASQPETTRFDYRVEPLVDLYHYVREQVTRDGEPDAPAEFAAAVAAARKLREKLGTNTLAWSLLDQHLPAGRTAAELKSAFAGLPAQVRTFSGETVEIRDDAVALADALTAVESAHRQLLWPRHEAAIRAARERIEEQFRPREAECVRYMVESLGMQDPRDVVPVYLVFRSTWPEAYTIERPDGGGLVFVAVAREEHAGTLLFEIVLHEATHALDVRTNEDASVFKQIRDRLEAAGMSPRDRDFRNVPHTIMFIQAGETVRRIVSPEHRHYGVASAYYERTGRVAEVERRVWTDYLDGKLSRDEAVDTIVRELTKSD